MFDLAPARPALLPSILFISASLAALESPVRGPLAAATLLGLLATLLPPRGMRSFDRLLLISATLLGFANGALAAQSFDAARGNAALALPSGRPFQRSFVGSLRSAPLRGDDGSWTLTVDAVPEAQQPVPIEPIRLRLSVAGGGSDRSVLADLRPGQSVRFWARVQIPAARPAAQQLWRRGLIGTGRVKSERLIEPLERRDRPLSFASGRAVARQRLHRLYGDDRSLSDFLSAVLLGDRTPGPSELQARLRAAGLSHLLAISGLHVGLVAWLLFAVTQRIFRRPLPIALVAGVALVGFGGWVQWAVPVQRAVGAALLLLAGRTLGRDGDPLNRLACVAAGLAVLDPRQIASAGFALSFAATAAILVALHRRPRSGLLAGSFRVSVAAYLGTAPLAAFYFGELAPWAPLANLLALPFVFLTLGAGYASLLFDHVPLFETLTRGSFSAIDAIAGTVDRLPGSPLAVAAPDPLLLLALAIVALPALATLGDSRSRNLYRFALACGFVWIHLGPPPPDGPPSAQLLDVGQGQALLWQDRGRTSLIDAAGQGYGSWDPGARIVRPALLALGIQRLDRLILSHGDADHAAGARAILEGMQVGELWLGPGWWRHRRLRALAALARERGSAIRLVSAGDSVASIQVHAPQRDYSGPVGNAGSLVLTLGRAPFRLFVPGDLDGRALRRLLERVALPQADAIVLAHHGSRSGTPQRLLDRLRPRLALVSCGWRNRFGHPHTDTVRRLRRNGIALWRTDHDGTIDLRQGAVGWSATGAR